MGGRAALIVVMGFGVILGTIVARLNWITSSSTESYVSYNSFTVSHDLAQAGANAGLSKLYLTPTLMRTSAVLSTQTFTSGYYAGGSFTVRIDTGIPSLATVPETLRSYSTYSSPSPPYFTLHDTVVVILKPVSPDSFKILGVMQGFQGAGSDQWCGYDTMDGRFHSNGNVKIFGSSAVGDSAVFKQKATTAKSFVGSAVAKFLNGKEEGVKNIAFPIDSDLTRVTWPCHDVVDSPIAIPITEPLTLQFVNPSGANNDGVILAWRGLHSNGTGGVFYSSNTGTSWLKRDSLLTGNSIFLVRTKGSAGANFYSGMFATGTYKSTNKGVTWAAGPTGLSGKSVYWILDDSANNKLIAGTNNGIYTSGSNYGNWVTTASKIGVSGKKVTAMNWNHKTPPDTFYVGTADSGVWKAKNTESDNPVKYVHVLSNKKITALAVNSAGRVFAGTPDSLFISTDRGVNWRGTPTQTSQWNTTYHHYITCMAYNPAEGVLYIGTNTGEVYMSSDGQGTSWSATTNLDTISAPVSCLWVRTVSGVHSVVVGTAGNGIYASTNSGNTWVKRDSLLTNRAITSFADSSSSTSIKHFLASTHGGDTLHINDSTKFPHGVIYSNSDLSVYGTIDTRKRWVNGEEALGMTIVTTGDIWIESDLTYENNPVDSTSTSDDMLALISTNVIYINNSATNGLKDTTQKTWNVNAILFCMTASPHKTITAIIGTTNNPNWIGRLRTVGGVIASAFFDINWASGGGGFNGFHRSFKWDPRLQVNKKPPCFPTPLSNKEVPELKIFNWWENVRTPKF